MVDYWLRQTKSRPLYPDILWSRPENKKLAGTLLIIGGSQSNFSEVSRAYSTSTAAGVGSVFVLLPDSLSSVLKSSLKDARFLSSNKAGGLSKDNLDEVLSYAKNVDGVLITGDIGKNSETEILLQNFILKYSGLIITVSSSVNLLLHNKELLKAENLILVTDFSQLQNLNTTLNNPLPIKKADGIFNVVQALHSLSDLTKSYIVANLGEQVLVSSSGSVISSKLESQVNNVELASKLAVWAIQNNQQVLKGIISSLI